MRRVQIVADTTHYLPVESATENGIELVSLMIGWNGELEPESAVTDRFVFFERLRSADTLPDTEPPPVDELVKLYRTALERGDDVVSIHISQALSNTYARAIEAKELVEQELGSGDRISVIDSETACGGMGLVVLAAAAEANNGGSRTHVVERAEKAREELKMWFYVDTLEFLRRGGRIGAARALIGSTLRIKPILTLDREIAPVEQVRTGERARERMIDYLRVRHEDGADAWFVQHVQAEQRAEEIAEVGREIFGKEPVFISEIGPVVGSHLGPGMIAVGAIPSNLLS